MTKTIFPLGVVLSITHGILLCEFSRVYEILNFMTGDNLMTHQLPRAGRECAPWLLRQFPQLAAIDLGGIGELTWRDRLAVLVAEYGDSFEVVPIPRDDHERKNPLTELAEMVDPNKIIVIERTEHGG